MAATKHTRRSEAIEIRSEDCKPEGRITQIRISGAIDVAARDHWICLWTAGREVRIGPLTPEQAEKLSEDLGYEAVEE
jgi:hypothetical protein